jgi:hypothetical protein
MPFYSWLRPLPDAGPVHAAEHEDLDTQRRRDLETRRRAAHKLKALRAALAAHIRDAELPAGTRLPGDSARIVRIATWNLREFDSTSYGWRTPEAKAYIAEILAHFDLVALQEIRRDLGPLNDLRRLLGPGWAYIATDVTEGSQGNDERMAFLYNRDKVRFRDVAGELTLPHGQRVTDPFGERFMVAGGALLELPDGETLRSPTGLRTDTLANGDTKIEEDVEILLPAGTRVTLPAGTAIRFARNARVPLTPDDAIALEAGRTPRLPEAAEIVLPPNSLVGGPAQFARTPFIASFQAGWLRINLATVHIYYGSDEPAALRRRADEIARLTGLLAERAASDRDSDADAFFIALGDFNIAGPGDATMAALRSNGFDIPEPLQHIPGSNVRQDKFYDQIALWTGESSRRRGVARIRPYRAGVFDFFDTVFRADEEAVYRPFMDKPHKPGEQYASYERWRTYQMSDHLPMWVELHSDFADEYLDDVLAEVEGRLG